MEDLLGFMSIALLGAGAIILSLLDMVARQEDQINKQSVMLKKVIKSSPDDSSSGESGCGGCLAAGLLLSTIVLVFVELLT